MELLRAHNLMAGHGNKVLFKNLNLNIHENQRIGLIGKNGAGKSTLLHMLARTQLPAEQGKLTRYPGVRLNLHTQHPLNPSQSLYDNARQALAFVFETERAMRHEEQRLSAGEDRFEVYAELTRLFEQLDGYKAESRLEATLLGLGFESSRWHTPVSSLSGGEQARLGVALSLLTQADVLLLDEPSNHLDIRMRQWLRTTLKRYNGSLVIATHDRALLQDVCTHIALLDAGTLTVFKGSYAQFKTQQDVNQRTHAKQHKEREKEQARLHAIQEQLRQFGTAKAHKQRKSTEKKLERLKGTPQIIHNISNGATLGNTSASVRQAQGALLKARHLSKRYAGTPLFTNVSLQINAGDKIALLGTNGSGKSSLLSMIHGDTESDDPKAQFFWHKDVRVMLMDQQRHGLNDQQPLIEQLQAWVHATRAEQLLSLVGLPYDLWRSLPQQLSGGERARAGVALLIASEANLLLLDEPTNHLDISMIETLESHLVHTRAAVLMVTHDDDLTRAVATRVWSLEEGQLREYRGGLDGFFAGNDRVSAPAVTVIAEDDTPETADTVPLETSLEQLEDARLELEAFLSDPLQLSERDKARYEQQLQDVIHALSDVHEQRYAKHQPAAARYTLKHQHVTLWSDGVTNTTTANNTPQTVLFNSSTGATGRVMINDRHVAHISLTPAKNTCLLPYAQTQLLELVVQLLFEHLGVRVAQVQSDTPVVSEVFKPAGEGWFLASRDAYEQSLGLPRVTKQRVKRKVLYFHPDFMHWRAARRWQQKKKRTFAKDT